MRTPPSPMPFKITLEVQGEYEDALGNVRRILKIEDGYVTYEVASGHRPTRKLGAKGECSEQNFRHWSRKQIKKGNG